MPTALVTCGPSYEPIDAVRRLTNHATGEIGTRLSSALRENGFQVLCLRGGSASYPAPEGVQLRPFGTNSSLSAALEEIAEAPELIFHAAALADFQLASVSGTEPGSSRLTKLRSDTKELILKLVPAEKILPRLRLLFPEALIVGWKYETDGGPMECLERAKMQITRAQTDACVANGPAYGAGFGFLEAGQDLPRHFATKPLLADFLAEWGRSQLG